jgi:hypothetical protein
MEFFKTHPYLIANIPLLFLILALTKAVQPTQYGRLSLLSGLVCIPYSILALLHNESYWKPVRLGGWPIGIEDLVFTFISGAMVWLLVARPYRRNLAMDHLLSLWGIRYISITLLFGGFGLFLGCAGVKSLENTLITCTLALAGLLILRRTLWPLAVRGVVLFLPIYILIVQVQFSIWPDYLLQWNLNGPLGLTIMGIPVGEFAWAAVFAAVWPVYVAFVFDVRWAAMPVVSPGMRD